MLRDQMDSDIREALYFGELFAQSYDTAEPQSILIHEMHERIPLTFSQIMSGRAFMLTFVRILNFEFVCLLL